MNRRLLIENSIYFSSTYMVYIELKKGVYIELEALIKLHPTYIAMNPIKSLLQNEDLTSNGIIYLTDTDDSSEYNYFDGFVTDYFILELTKKYPELYKFFKQKLTNYVEFE